MVHNFQDETYHSPSEGMLPEIYQSSTNSYAYVSAEACVPLVPRLMTYSCLGSPQLSRPITNVAA